MNKFFVGVIICLTLLGCSKDIGVTNKSSTILGVVSDWRTGAPISNVSVDLREGLALDCLGASVGKNLTGTDGYYQINDIDPDKDYFIIFEHVDYIRAGQRVELKINSKVELNVVMSHK